MAKRRKLEAPSAADIDKIEAEFRRETTQPDTRRAAPIAQVARETAAAMQFADSGERDARAQDSRDAEQLRKAQADGALMVDIPLDQINADSMIRDRSVLDRVALDELRMSIMKTGMRLPIEVYELADARDDGPKYGLLSGYRRYQVLSRLSKDITTGAYDTVRAIIRRPDTDADRFAAMVEENEIRQQLSHYERGRVVALAAQQGIFPNSEAAVAALFPVASKAKRSKIRSFAMIFEELGDLLEFPENLREKDGLKIAGALRDGREEELRHALEAGRAADPQAEWDLLSETLDQLAPQEKRPSRGGRPKAKIAASGWDGTKLRLSSGVVLRKGSDASGYTVHISGQGITPDLLDRLMEQLQYALDKPD